VPDRVKPSFVIFDIRALWRSGLSVRVPGCQKIQMTAYQVWHRMFYSCTHVAIVGVKGLAAARYFRQTRIRPGVLSCPTITVLLAVRSVIDEYCAIIIRRARPSSSAADTGTTYWPPAVHHDASRDLQGAGRPVGHGVVTHSQLWTRAARWWHLLETIRQVNLPPVNRQHNYGVCKGVYKEKKLEQNTMTISIQSGPSPVRQEAAVLKEAAECALQKYGLLTFK